MRYIVHILKFQLITCVLTVIVYFAYGAEWGNSVLEGWIQFGSSIVGLSMLSVLMITTYSSDVQLSGLQKFLGMWSLLIGFHITAYVLNSVNILDRNINHEDMMTALKGIPANAIIFGIFSGILSTIVRNRIRTK